MASGFVLGALVTSTHCRECLSPSLPAASPDSHFECPGGSSVGDALFFSQEPQRIGELSAEPLHRHIFGFSNGDLVVE